MSRRTVVAVLMSVAGAIISFAVLHAAGPQDGGRPQTKGAESRSGGPSGPPPGPGFGPGMFLAPQIIEMADTNADGVLSPDEAAKAAEKFIREADSEKKGSLDAAALGRAMNRRMGPPPGFGPGGPPDGPGGGPPGGPGDFGPGTFLAPRILEAADANKDGRLAPDEAATAAEGFVRAADTKKKGSLDEDTLAGAINQRMGPGPGGPGGPMGQERKLVKQFDKDADGRLNKEERQAARAFLKEDSKKGGGRGRPPFGPPPGFGGQQEPEVKPGLQLDPDSVAAITARALYDATVIRTLFLEFEDKDWEAQLADFHHTDVELPAKLIVDGKKYTNVGVHFRGLSSFMMVREGHKRSLNIALDFVDPTQRLYGYKTLNLLNSHEDPTFLHTVLYLQIARNYIPAPKANFVKLAINGESWGLYVNVQQFDKNFLAESFPSSKGTRWKVKGSPGGGGGLDYIGDNVEDYKRRYEIKSEDSSSAWKGLIELCRILNQTPLDRLEEALKPILAIDEALWFLALDNALVNNDGYWVRASDYSIFRDQNGKFHIVPHDTNETFQTNAGFGPPGGFGRGGPGGGRGGTRRGPGGGPGPGGPGRGPGPNAGPGDGAGGTPAAAGQPSGIVLDPLVGLNDSAKPLRSRLLAVPSLKAQYLDHVRTIALDWLDWHKLKPVIDQYRSLIASEIEADTRKLSSYASFQKSLADAEETKAEAPRGRPSLSLEAFAKQRRAFLLNYPGIKNNAPTP
jgi:CotH kinase protein/EF hand